MALGIKRVPLYVQVPKASGSMWPSDPAYLTFFSPMEEVLDNAAIVSVVPFKDFCKSLITLG